VSSHRTPKKWNNQDRRVFLLIESVLPFASVTPCRRRAARRLVRGIAGSNSLEYLHDGRLLRPEATCRVLQPRFIA
jgi:hypothetical protein